MTPAVSSVEPSSTTMTSVGGRVWLRIESIVSEISAARLKVGMITETSKGMGRLYSAGPPQVAYIFCRGRAGSLVSGQVRGHSGGIRGMTVFSLLHKVGRLAPPGLKRRIRRLPFAQQLYERAVIPLKYERVFGRPPDLRAPI